MIDTDTHGFAWACTPEPEGDPCKPVFQHCDECNGEDENCQMCGGTGGGFCCQHDLSTTNPDAEAKE